LTLALVLSALLAVVCVVAVALPFLKDPEPASDILDELDDHERRRLELVEARDRALAALKELEFDHRTGAVSDQDYRALVGPLRREAANALQSLERAGPRTVVEASREEGRPTRERIS
jgi:Mg/Co/Ni transporter MgtE